jgi:DNA-directed RNA polymerase subunit alpha
VPDLSPVERDLWGLGAKMSAVDRLRAKRAKKAAAAALAIEAIPYGPVMLKKVSDLDLSVRAGNRLEYANIVYIGDLVQKTEAEMLRARIFGRTLLNEIREALARMGLHLGMEVPGWPPEKIEDLANAAASLVES